MRIAQIAPPWIAVPPDGYGGIEWVVQQLCDGLVARGHEVVLFATGDSVVDAELRSVFEKQQPELMHSVSILARHVAFALEGIEEFDVVHDHSGFLLIAFAKYLDTPPILHTIHGAFDETAYPLYQQFADAVSYCSISNYQQSLAPPGMRWAGNVYNGVDVSTWPYREDKDGYLLALGRVCEDKGFHVAIDVARRTGRRLIMAGALQDLNREYFETRIAPQLDDQIRYVGEVDDRKKRELFAGASAYLFPILWPEPFGIVMLESLACGTPVVAFRNGSVDEVIEDGLTGFIVNDSDGMVDALDRLGDIDPAVCRRAAEERFSVDHMVREYERLYRSISSTE
jgi:glycosyltransferase involved in cell wall biosynthesis